MRKCVHSLMVVGVVFIALGGCRPTTTEEETASSDAEPALTAQAPEEAVTAVTQQITPTHTPPPSEIPPPPPRPTPQPTSSLADNWRFVGSTSAGIELAIPMDWVDISDSLDVATATNPLGFNILLLADSQRTGRSLLAGKTIREGAFGVGLIIGQSLPDDDPVAALTQLVSEMETAVTPLNQAQSATADNPNAIPAASIDITGDPLGFFDDDGDTLRSRLVLFLPQKENRQNGRAATLILLSAPTDQWQRYANTFDQIAHSAIIYNISSGETLNAGNVNLIGGLVDGKSLNATLTGGIKDVWTFSITEARYATLSLSPDDKELDLTLTLISPSGQTIAQVDGGYAGDTEVIADVYLTENGRYVVEVSDFFNQSGRYNLSLTLNEEPGFTSAGDISPGQSIQSRLPVNTRHVWTFDGDAEHLISIVLTPDDNQMDAILNLYGPDGQRLVALDEGFSGDPEVISGFELPVTGSYSIVVSSFADNGGLYTLTLDEGGEAIQNFYDAGDLAYGDVKTETLQAGEAHAWFFEGRADDAVHIAARPLDDILDLDVWLFDPDIERIEAVDTFTAGETETVELVLPRDGQYLILVRDFFSEGGQYEIELSASPATAPKFAGQVSYGKTVTGTLSSGQTTLWYFDGNEKDVIDIELSPASATDDVVLILQDPDGSVVLEIDEAPAGESEFLNAFSLTADGLWGVVVADFFDEGVVYALTVQRSQ